MAAVVLPTTLNLQSPNIKVLTGNYLTQHVETVPVDTTSWAYVMDGEWIELTSTGVYRVPGSGAIPAVVALNTKTLYLVLGKTVEPSRYTLTREIRDYATPAFGGHLNVFEAELPVELDTKIYDEEATWTVGADAYLISGLDADGNARVVLSTAATGAGGLAGKKIGVVLAVPSANNGFARIRWTTA